MNGTVFSLKKKLTGSLFIKLGKLLEDRGHVGHPLPDLSRGPLSGEVSQLPGARLSFTVDVGHHRMPLSSHNQFCMVLEVIDLKVENMFK